MQGVHTECILATMFVARLHEDSSIYQESSHKPLLHVVDPYEIDLEHKS